jgi:hypothetical protein
MEAWVVPAGLLLVLILLAPGKLGERLIGTVFQLVLWIVKIPFRAGRALFRTSQAWLDMEIRRWVGILVGGLLVLILAQAIVKATPPGSSWRLAALLMCLIWLVALFSAARLTMEYFSLRRVRQTQAFFELTEGVRNLQGQVTTLQGQVVSTAAQQAPRTPVEGVFSANRSARAEERVAAESTAEQVETDRLVAQEAARQARAAHEGRMRVPDAMSPDHDPFQ